jgi:Mg2+ and Co2+ transporter CorA
MPEFLAAIKSTQDEIDRIEAQIKEEPDNGMEIPTLAEAIKRIKSLRSSLQNPDQDVELKRNILAHLIHQIKIPPRGHGELEYYDPQQHLPLVLAKKDDGREASRNASRPVALTLVTPRGVEPPFPE